MEHADEPFRGGPETLLIRGRTGEAARAACAAGGAPWVEGASALVLEEFAGEPEVLGVAVVTVTGPMMVLWALAVPSPCRGRGYGRRLLQAAADSARSQGAERLIVHLTDRDSTTRAWLISNGMRVASGGLFAELEL